MQIIDKSVYTFSRDNAPHATAAPGEILCFKTSDCFAGQLYEESQLLHQLDLTRVNPAAGPVFIKGAVPGDILAVDILDIKTHKAGVACSMGETGPLAYQSQLRTRLIPVENRVATFNDLQWLVTPMIGVIGTAPAEDAIPCGLAASHGGNMDSRLITKGARVYLPVQVEGALLQLGDLHASMGDGEVCGTGIEISGEVLARTKLIKNRALHWPVTETTDAWYVNTAAASYDEALKAAATELCRLMQPVYGWDATDIFIYLSINGNVGINQGFVPASGSMLTLRFGIPKVATKGPLL